MTAGSARPILVVDDDPKIVRLVADVPGARRTPGHGGARTDAARRSSRWPLTRRALVVLDLMIPEVSGLDILVRTRARGSRVPILVLSARGLTSDRIAGLEAGADDYLPKPFSPAELVLRVRRLLERSGPGHHAAAARPPLVLGDLVVDRDRYEAQRRRPARHAHPDQLPAAGDAAGG